MKRILITGSRGFIGRNLCELLKGKYELFSPSSEELDLLNSDETRNYLHEHQCDILIHTANCNPMRKSSILSYDSLDGNLRMFFNLESCCEDYGKMLYFGSGAEYDSNFYVPNMKEEYFGNYVPRDPYGFSKYVMSKYTESSTKVFDLRLFGVYGKYEEWERRFISNAICRSLKNKPITIQKNVYFDYLWVEDLGQIVEWFIENIPQYHHYNVCRGEAIDLLTLANMVKDITKNPYEVQIAQQGLKLEYSGSNERLIKEMGSFCFRDFNDSIGDLVDYYCGIIDEIDENKFI